MPRQSTVKSYTQYKCGKAIEVKSHSRSIWQSKGDNRCHNAALKAWETRRGNHNATAWNKGLTKEIDERVARQAQSMRGKAKNYPNWSKGLTKETNESLKRLSEINSIAAKNWWETLPPDKKILMKQALSNSMRKYFANESIEHRNRRVRNSRKASHQRPTKLEKELEIIINKACPNEYKYVGDGSVILNGINPDFININGKKKIIEGFGNYWHSPEVIKNNWKATELGRIMVYNSLGFDCLVLWEQDLENKTEEELILEIRNFNAKILNKKK